MENQGIIIKSQSPFGSPIVMVPKKNSGKWRMAIDYRRLNALTKKQIHILPHIQDALDIMAGRKIYSTFDLTAGYHQIEIVEEHAERTSFISHMGLFHFLRLPFGLVSAPSTFQAVMSEVIRELGSNFLVYLDDIILANDNEVEHLQQIESFFETIQNNGLKLNIEKCVFGRRQIKYLGFILSSQGISPDKKNVEAVQRFEKPKTVSELRS